MNQTTNTGKYQPGGLWSRFTGLFAQKGGQGFKMDKLAILKLLLDAILILGAARVFDAVLTVSASMPPVLRFGVALFTLALTEGGFVAWLNLRYDSDANQTQRDVALIGMVVSALASLAVGISDYAGAALGANGIDVAGTLLTGNVLMIWVVGAAYGIAIIGHLVCIFLAREFDDDVQAELDLNVINQQVAAQLRSTESVRRRAEAAANALVSQAKVVTGVLARLTIAPTAAAVAAVTNARKTILDEYGEFVSDRQVDDLLGATMSDMPAFIEQAYVNALKAYLQGDGAHDLGLDPEKVATAIRKSTANLEGTLRGSFGSQPALVDHKLRPLRPLTVNSVPKVPPLTARAVRPIPHPNISLYYTLDQLLKHLDKTPDEARAMLAEYELTEAGQAFELLSQYHLLPVNLTPGNFSELFAELMRPASPAPAKPQNLDGVLLTGIQPVPETVYGPSGNGNGNGHVPGGTSPNFH